MMAVRNLNSVIHRGPTELDRLTDPISPKMIGLHSGPNITDLAFVFAAYVIRAYPRGASFGTRLIGGKHGPFIALAMASVIIPQLKLQTI